MLDRQLTPSFLARSKVLFALVGLALLTAACGQGHDMGGMSGQPTGTAGGHDGHAGSSPQTALTADWNGYRFSPAATAMPSGPAQRFSFKILNPTGGAQTQFAVDQTKRLHLYVIRRDLTNFGHVHPEMATDGTWATPLNLASPGPYRVVADFIALDDKGKQVKLALGVDLAVPGDYTAAALPSPVPTSAVDGYQVELKGSPRAGMEHKLTFVIRQSGSAVTNVEPYLDAFGHLTAFRAGDLAYAHLHPAGTAAPGSRGGPNLEFKATLPASGDYRLFLQFQTAGGLHTAPFTVPPN